MSGPRTSLIAVLLGNVNVPSASKFQVLVTLALLVVNSRDLLAGTAISVVPLTYVLVVYSIPLKFGVAACPASLAQVKFSICPSAPLFPHCILIG